MILTQENYVKKAEDVIKKMADFKDQKGHSRRITTSQIRNLLSMTADIHNQIRGVRKEQLDDELIGRISYLKIRFIYEAGRDRNMKEFVENTEILRCLDEIQGKRSRFILFSKYMEALVAYHKFYDGKD